MSESVTYRKKERVTSEYIIVDMDLHNFEIA